MAYFNQATNEMVTCPYDPSHRMLRSRFQMHIVKCRRNHEDLQFKTCPFNATHLIDGALYKDHLINCPDRIVVDKKLAAELDKNNIYKGNTSVPSYHQQNIPECTEIWDVDDDPVAGYVPSLDPLANGLVQDLGLMKPAERKQIYRELHRVDGNETTVKTFQPAPSPQPIREPKLKHQDVLMQSSHIREQAASAGLGRGQAKIESRIAANIFDHSRTNAEPTTSRSSPNTRQQPMSYKQVLSGMNKMNLGLGRGQPMQANYKEDFPALGLGRGVQPS